jgi:endonuclease/exonuclease/phosphatase family metal-dependent hydrolase
MRGPRFLRLLLAVTGALATGALLAGPAAARDEGPPKPLTPGEPQPKPLTPSENPPKPLTPSEPPPVPAPIEVPMAPITPRMASVKPTEPVPGPPRKTPAKRQVKVKVMSFNINSITAAGVPVVAYPPPWFGRNGARDKRSADIIAGSGAEVVVIDEAFDSGAEEMAAELMSRGYRYQTPVVGETCPAEGKAGGGWNGTYGHCDNYIWEKNGGTMILSQLPILEKWQYIFKEGAESDNLSNKGVALVALEAPGGGVFWVAGTHLQSSDSSPFDPNGEFETIRKEQLLEMSSFIAARANVAKETVLVAGDLNVPVYYDRMAGAGGRLVMDWGEHLPALNLFTPLLTSPGGVSVNCVDNVIACGAQVLAPYKDGYQDSLDYLGYYAGTDADPGVRPLDQTPPRVIDTVRKEHNGYAESPSDHFPTWSRFTLGLAQEHVQKGGSTGPGGSGTGRDPDSN